MSYLQVSVAKRPPLRRRGRPGKNWVPIAEKMVDVAPEAVFVKADGMTPIQIRDNARKSFDHYFGGSGVVHSQIRPNGVYFWVDLDVLAERAERA